MIRLLKEAYQKHIIVIVFFILLSFSVFSAALSENKGVILPDTPYSIDSFIKIFLNQYSWSELLGKTHTTQEFFFGLFLSPMLLLSIFFNISTYQMYVVLEIFIFVLSGISMYSLSYHLLKSSTKNNQSKVFICCFISGLLYMFNPSFMIADVQRYATILGYAIFPLIILFFIKAIDEYNKKYAVFTALLVFYSFIFDFRYFASALIFFFSYIIFNRITMRNVTVRNVKILSLTLIILLALFFPTIFSWYSGRSVSTDVPLSINAIDIPWGNAQPINMLRGMSFMSIPGSYSNTPLQITDYYFLTKPITFLVPIFAFLAILFYPKNKKILFFTLIASGFLLIFSFKDFLYWLTLDAPLHNFIGRMFRTTRILDLFVSLSHSVLIGFSLLYVITFIRSRVKRNIYQIFFIALMLFMLISSVMITSWPLMTGGINKKFVSSNLPDEYTDTNNWLKNQSGDYKVLWLPEFYSAYQPVWSNGSADNILTYSSAKPTYYSQDRISKQYFDYTTTIWYNSLLSNTNFNSLSDFLSNVGIKYIVLHNDTKYLQGKTTEIIIKLNESKYFELVQEENFIYVFENKKYDSRKIFIPKKMILISGGLETGKNIQKILLGTNLSISPNDYGIIYIDQEKDIGANLQNFDAIVVTNSKTITDLMIPFIDKKYLIVPFDYSREYAPNDKWSKGLLTDSHHAVWHNYVNGLNNQKWEFSTELNYGFIFTRGNDMIDIPVMAEKDGTYNIFFRILKNSEGGAIKFYFDKQEIATVDAFEKDNSEFIWYNISSTDISSGKHIISIENVAGFNAINIGLFVPREDYDYVRQRTVEQLSNKEIIYYIDMNKITYLFDNNDTSITSIKPFIEGDYSVYITNKNYTNNASDIYLKDALQNLTFTGRYNNLAKNIIFDNKNISKNFSASIDCTDKLNEKCSYKVTTNTQNSEWSWMKKDIGVTPEKEYLVTTYMKCENTNQSHISIDAYNESSQSYYRLTNLPDGRTCVGTSDWREFSTKLKVPKGVKRLSFILNAGWVGDISLGNATTWFYDVVIYEVEDTDANSILLINKQNESLDDVFTVNETSAIVLNYTKLNPTLYKVKVNAKKPYMLSFAESYDPLWYVRIDKINGKAVKSDMVRSVPLYSVINGFWINQTGDLDITIEFEPQKWFYVDAAISLTTLLLSVLYLIYDWRRNKRKEKETAEIDNKKQ